MVSELEGSVGKGIRIVVEGKRFGFSSEKPFASSILSVLTLNLRAISGIVSSQLTKYVSKYFVPLSV